jgi:hypothetical protein
LPDTHVPVAVMRYRLTRADALAWFALSREMTWPGRLAFILWFALAGAVLAVLPPAVVGATGSLRSWAVLAVVVLVQYALMVGVMTLRRHWRARRMLAQHVDVVLEVWGDHLGATRAGVVLNVAPELIRQVVVTDAHVFLDILNDVLIVPLHAFADLAEMQAFGAEWDRLSHEAEP